MSFDLTRYLRGIPTREKRETFVRKAKMTLARIWAGRPREQTMRSADSMACYDHLVDLAREHDVLTDAETHDRFPRLILPPSPPFSGAGSPAAMCADGAPYRGRQDRPRKREALA